MKKWKAVLLTLPLLLFTACGSTEGAGNASDTTNGEALPQVTESVDTEAADNAENNDNTEAANDTQSEEHEVKPIDYEIDPTKPVIALTFDDGPNTTTTNQVLDLLDKYQVRASFFLIGDNINDESAKSVKRAFDMGCEINNHSKTHSYMNEMTPDDIKAEVDYVSEKVKEITGKGTAFFRPPYIAVNDTMYENIDMPFISGYGCNDWDSNVPVDRRLKIMRRHYADGVIFLLHDVQGNDKTVEMLDTLIPELLEEGYQFVTVSELFEIKGVEISGEDTNLYNEVPVAAQ